MRYRCCCFKKEYIFLLLFSSANRATATPVSYRRVCVRLYMYSYFCLLKLTNRSSSLSLSHSSLPFFYLCCSKEAGACVCQCEGEVRRQAERRWYFTTLFVTRRRGLPSSLFFFSFVFLFFSWVWSALIAWRRSTTTSQKEDGAVDLHFWRLPILPKLFKTGES